MALSQFNCPHCRSPFQAETSLPSLQVACPHCRQPVALIGQPPVVAPPLAAPPVLDPPIAEPPRAEPATLEPPIHLPRGYPPVELPPPSAAVAPERAAPQPATSHESIADDYRSRQLAADDRATRKFVKNMIVWVCCAIVLVSILALFVIRGRS